MIDLKQVDLKQVRDEVADRVGRAAKELSSGAGNAARELGASAEESISTQIRKQAKLARNRTPRRGPPTRLSGLTAALVGAAAGRPDAAFDPDRRHCGRCRGVSLRSGAGSPPARAAGRSGGCPASSRLA